jgi:hypothetical protein
VRRLEREIANLKLNYAVLDKKIDQLDVVIQAVEDRDNNLYRTYFNTSLFQRGSQMLFTDANRYRELEAMTIGN